MKPYRYLRDPLFLVCFTTYFINRLAIKQYLPNSFSQSYFNDLICIPFWLPIMLWVMRRLRLRAHDLPPTASEILIPLLVWSYLFECVAPYMQPWRGFAFGDPLDILCYVTGALVSAVFWKCYYSPRPALTTPATHPH